MLDKKKISEKWKPLLDSIGLSGKTWFEEYANYHSEMDRTIIGSMPIDTGYTTSSYDWSKPLLPMAMRVASHTLAAGGWEKSAKQKLKEGRINKLRKLKGKKPNVVLPNDIYVDGLVSVTPMSGPTGTLMYMDFVYGGTETKKEKLRKSRKEKLIKIDRINKIKYIEEILQKNNQ